MKTLTCGVSPQGVAREGIQAFFEKRPAAWIRAS
jgi:hypothetical protein